MFHTLHDVEASIGRMTFSDVNPMDVSTSPLCHPPTACSPTYTHTSPFSTTMLTSPSTPTHTTTLWHQLSNIYTHAHSLIFTHAQGCSHAHPHKHIHKQVHGCTHAHPFKCIHKPRFKHTITTRAHTHTPTHIPMLTNTIPK